MRKLPSLLTILFLLSLPSRAADLAGCLAWEIPEGPVSRVEVDGTTVWPSIPYVTNGLIAYWDACWNAGLGVHDNTATVWRDLSGSGFDATQRVASGWSWQSDAYVGTTANGHGFVIPLGFSVEMSNAFRHATVEMVYTPVEQRTECIFGQYAGGDGNGSQFLFWGAQNALYALWKTLPNTPLQCWTSALGGYRRVTCAMTYDNLAMELYYDGTHGETRSAVDVENHNYPNIEWVLGGEPARSNYSILGMLSAVRVYNRPLSSAEIAHNAEIDAIRYGIVSEAPSAEMLSASSPRSLSILPRLELQSIPAEATILVPVHPCPTPY